MREAAASAGEIRIFDAAAYGIKESSLKFLLNTSHKKGNFSDGFIGSGLQDPSNRLDAQLRRVLGIGEIFISLLVATTLRVPFRITSNDK